MKDYYFAQRKDGRVRIQILNDDGAAIQVHTVFDDGRAEVNHQDGPAETFVVPDAVVARARTLVPTHGEYITAKGEIWDIFARRVRPAA